MINANLTLPVGNALWNIDLRLAGSTTKNLGCRVAHDIIAIFPDLYDHRIPPAANRSLPANCRCDTVHDRATQYKIGRSGGRRRIALTCAAFSFSSIQGHCGLNNNERIFYSPKRSAIASAWSTAERSLRISCVVVRMFSISRLVSRRGSTSAGIAVAASS